MELLRHFFRLTHLMVILPVYLTAANWSTPVSLGLQSSDYSDLTTDSQGNTYAIWTYSIGNVAFIKAAKQTAGETDWGNPVILSLPGQVATYSKIAVDSNGNIVVLWTGSTETTESVQAAVLPVATGKWRLTHAIPALPSQQIHTIPKVAFDAQGNALAVWGAYRQTNGVGNFYIQAARLSTDGEYNWTAVTEFPNIHPDNLQLAVDPAGNAIILWSDYETIRSATLAAGASEWIPQVDPLSAPYYAQSLQLVVDANGNAVAAWWELGNDIANRAFSLPFGASQWIETTLPDTYAFNPRLKIDGSGTAYILYHGYGENQTYALRSSTLPSLGTTWTAPKLVLPATSSTDNYELAVDNAGNALAVWGDNTNKIVQASTLTAGQDWSSPVQLASTNYTEALPRIALTQTGTCVVAFTENSETPPLYPWQYIINSVNGDQLFAAPVTKGGKNRALRNKN